LLRHAGRRCGCLEREGLSRVVRRQQQPARWLVGGGSGSKSNSILLVVRDSTPDCHVIACDRKRSHEIANLMSTTVRVLENASGTRSGTESLPKVFLHDNCEQISFIIFFAFLKKEEMRSGTHFTQLNVFLLLTVVVTKHVWPYFQSRFPKTSSERVSS
jgi:hypothetical protein